MRQAQAQEAGENGRQEPFKRKLVDIEKLD
jgi:hypothetical protein